MKGFLSLLVIIVGLAAGWMYRDEISNLLPRRDTASDSLTASHRAATPHPALQAKAQAAALYPGLAIANSALNQKFVALYKEAQSNNSPLLSHPNWPLTLAERAVVSLGGAPMQRTSNQQAQTTKQVVIYTTSHCPYCKQAKQYFFEKRIPYQEIDIERSSTGNDAFRKLGGDGVPLIMVGDKKVQGFNQKELDRLLL